MLRRVFALGNLTALALVGSLLAARPAAAQQGWNLYEWSRGEASSLNPTFYPGSSETPSSEAPGFETATPTYPTGYGAAYFGTPGFYSAMPSYYNGTGY